MLRHRCYKSAKRGSLSKARILVSELLSNLNQFAFPGTHVAPVYKSSGNKIALALAEKLAQDSSLILDTDILLNHSVHGPTMIDRIYYSPEYSGIVKPVNYVICDDVYTSGQTLIAMKNYIESRGGNVIRIVTIGSSASTLIEPPKRSLQILESRFPGIWNYFDIESLTAPQIVYLLRFHSLQSFFNRYYEYSLKLLYS